MTKKIFLRLTGMLFLLVLLGCRQELVNEQNQETASNNGRIISLKTINLSKENPIAAKIGKQNFASKTTDTVFVDYNHVEYLDYGDRETYTFKVLNSNPTAPLQNIVVTEYPNGTSSTKTVTYNLTETEKTELLRGNSINFSQKISSINSGTNSASGKYMVNGKCYEDEVVYVSCGSGQHNSTNVEEWYKCVHPIKPRTVIVAHEVSCTDSGGGGSTGSISVPLPPSDPEPGDLDLTTPTIPAPNNFGFVRFISTLPTDLQNIINNDYNNDYYWGLTNYYYTNNYTTEAKNFITWALQFKKANSDVTFEQFAEWFMNEDGTSNLNLESWFITKTEGIDGDFINDLDTILNTLQYQIKQMPTYSQFVSAFPKLDYPGYPGYFKQIPASQVYPMVGGNLENLYNTSGKDSGPYRNACTVRWSLAMNRMGYNIPNNSLSRQGENVNGSPRYYYIQAKTAGDYMFKTFGEVPVNHKLTGSDANDPIKVANFLKGKTGIYVIVNNDPRPTSQGGAGYTGHVDLIQNGHIPGGSNHLNVPGGIKYIRIWQFTP